ncbi:MAG: Hsp33 family molecular chaperone [Alphaproteobacteria bacterium]|nr:MAG: Hsp33 family molecular chaperone [Alphaproteobacteria bacterium]
MRKRRFSAGVSASPPGRWSREAPAMTAREGRPLDRPIILPGHDSDNRALPFAIEGMDVRGRAVRLGTAVDAIVTAHAYPPAVAGLLAETLALTALLGSLLKEDGVITVQAKGSTRAPIDFLVADFSTPGDLRGYATLHAGPDDVPPAEDAALGELLGAEGTLVITLDQGARGQRYQGVVPLDAPDLATAAESYFSRSEQIPTALRLAAGRDAVSGHWRARGIMIQHLARGGASGPAASEVEQENWRRARLLMESVRREELLDPQLDLETILFRLFHEDGVRVFEPIGIAPRCRCSRARLRDVIARFSAADRAEITIGGEIVARCQFCGKTYHFDPAEFEG